MQTNLADELVLFKNTVESIIKGSSTANKFFKLQLTSLRTRQVNVKDNLEHRLLLAYVYICYNSTTRAS